MEVKSKNIRNHHLGFFHLSFGMILVQWPPPQGYWNLILFMVQKSGELMISQGFISTVFWIMNKCIYACIYIHFLIYICKVYLCHNLYSCNMSEASSLGMVDFARSLYGHFAGRSRTRLCSGMAVMHCRRAEASILEPPRWEETVHPPLTGWR